ncbi:major facilitator superfamily domain-containing protein [Bisporella sp. PMI_857]|nr:major facilitator superfamily domain-containing protein [Bisporella sp. PMI_857]
MSSQQKKIQDDSDSGSQHSSEKGIANDVPGTLIRDAELVTARGNIVTKDGVVVSTQDSDASLSTNVFADPEVKAYYVAVYEKAQYECRHVFDADLTWTAEEEKKLVRKLDWHVCLWACVMFFSLQVDRGNISQAVSGTLLKDLKLNTNDFNLGTTVFTVSFLLAELPSQLISKKFGPDRWIPTQMVLWSIVAIAQGGLQNKAGFLACRALLGMLEGGFIPDLVLWLSYFYTSRELPIRLSFFWTALSVTSIITSLLAYAIFHLEGHLGVAGWRWLFMLEGALTLLIGITSFFLMPASAVQTKTWFRPNGWFTDRELSIVVNRVLRDDPSKGDMHNRQAITPRRLWAALKDYDLWPIYALGLICFVPQGPPAKYLTLILRQIGFSTFDTNLLTIPSSVLHIITLLGITWLSERLNQRAMIAIFQSIWTLPCVIALAVWPGLNVKQWETYALLVALLSYPYCHAINVGWASKNSNNVGSRSVSTALYNMCVQLGGIISANIYREDDKPLYRRGNRTLIGINVLAIILFIFAKVYYVLKNKSRDKRWNRLTAEEKIEYTRNTEDKASRRLDFRFAH